MRSLLITAALVAGLAGTAAPATETPYGIYVVDGRIDAFIAGGIANDFVLREL